MTEASQEQVAAAEAYEKLHVPALFRQWAGPVLDAARVAQGQRVLDVACGTGVVARQALTRVGPEGFVAGVDPGAGMLAVAARLAPKVEWRQGTAEAIPYADGSFDAVVSQFGMMFFSDRVGALREMLRVLGPGGRVSVAVWEALERSEAYPIEVELLERLAGSAAAEALRAPFVLGDPAELETLFVEAGVGAVAVETRRGTARFPSIRAMVEADLKGWLPVLGIELEEELIERILAEAEEALAEFVTADGRVEFEVPAHLVTGGKS